jgi:hypothetical protein
MYPIALGRHNSDSLTSDRKCGKSRLAEESGLQGAGEGEMGERLRVAWLMVLD